LESGERQRDGIETQRGGRREKTSEKKRRRKGGDIQKVH
jgi:hypothetical protein